MPKKLDLLILVGGRSAERDVSCVSTASIIKHADKKRYRLRLAHIDRRGRWSLIPNPLDLAKHLDPARFHFNGKPLRIELGGRDWLQAGSRSVPVDVVFPALHGPMGEDGTMQGLLELARVPYIGSDVLGSSVGMDKVMTKKVAIAAGLPVLPYEVIRSGTSLRAARRLRFPVFVKPNRMGSSVGVYKVAKPKDLPAAVRKSFRYDTTLVVEQGIPARELECALLGDEDKVLASGIGEISPNAEFYSYTAKYLDPDGADLYVPAPIKRRDAEKIRSLSIRAFKALGCSGLARADFMMEKRAGRIWFNEVNTIPGFTPESLYPRLWQAAGLSYPRLIDKLVALAMKRHKARARLRLSPL